MSAGFERDVERGSGRIGSCSAERFGLGMRASARLGQTARDYLTIPDNDRGHCGVGPGLGNSAPRQPRRRGQPEPVRLSVQPGSA